MKKARPAKGALSQIEPIDQRLINCISANAPATNTATPAISGKAVPSNISPTGTASTTEATVATDVITEAAKPAIWPTGSIASAFRLPIVIDIIEKRPMLQTICSGNARTSGIVPVAISARSIKVSASTDA